MGLLGYATEPRWVSSYPEVPRFCSVRLQPTAEDTDRMHFNAAEVGGARPDLVQICKEVVRHDGIGEDIAGATQTMWQAQAHDMQNQMFANERMQALVLEKQQQQRVKASALQRQTIEAADATTYQAADATTYQAADATTYQAAD